MTQEWEWGDTTRTTFSVSPSVRREWHSVKEKVSVLSPKDRHVWIVLTFNLSFYLKLSSVLYTSLLSLSYPLYLVPVYLLPFPLYLILFLLVSFFLLLFRSFSILSSFLSHPIISTFLRVLSPIFTTVILLSLSGTKRGKTGMCLVVRTRISMTYNETLLIPFFFPL